MENNTVLMLPAEAATLSFNVNKNKFHVFLQQIKNDIQNAINNGEYSSQTDFNYSILTQPVKDDLVDYIRQLGFKVEYTYTAAIRSWRIMINWEGCKPKIITQHIENITPESQPVINEPYNSISNYLNASDDENENTILLARDANYISDSNEKLYQLELKEKLSDINKEIKKATEKGYKMTYSYIKTECSKSIVDTLQALGYKIRLISQNYQCNTIFIEWS